MRRVLSRAAVAALQVALARDPNSPELHFGLGMTWRRLGRYGEAIAHLKQATQLRPDQAEMQYWLGAVYIDAGAPA